MELSNKINRTKRKGRKGRAKGGDGHVKMGGTNTRKGQVPRHAAGHLPNINLKVIYLVILALSVGDVNVLGGAGNLLVLLVGKDVNASNVGLGTTVLTSLRHGHLNDLAGVALEENEAVLAKSGALSGDDVGTNLGHVDDTKTGRAVTRPATQWTREDHESRTQQERRPLRRRRERTW